MNGATTHSSFREWGDHSLIFSNPLELMPWNPLLKTDVVHQTREKRLRRNCKWKGNSHNQVAFAFTLQARLLHHKPKYAILDECSSAISAEMERRLYRICMEQVRENVVRFLRVKNILMTKHTIIYQDRL